MWKRHRWRKYAGGILSTAAIGLNKVIPAMQKAQHCEIVAIASRDPAKAKSAAQKLDIPKAYGSYEELLADPDIEAIYNPLPNHLHVPWSMRALQAGKHVLCEKPIGLSSAEGQELVDAAGRHPHLKVMEAFMYRHHPQWQRARLIVREGGIGTLRTIQSFFSYYNDDPANIRNQADIGGGGLMDIGCYPISVSRFLFGREPRRVAAVAEFDPRLKTDRLTSVILDFQTGTSTFTCSTQLVPFQRVNLFGTSGRVEIEIPFNAPPDRPRKMWHESQGKTVEIVFPACDQYAIQGDLFSLAVRKGTPVPTPIEDAVANMRAIEAVIESHRTGLWTDVTA
ncbi:MAG TPA: Gfo/Idh/MocA family oxidoreductase [Planctomycetaceae bacterium]|nr:Gfo/Idh/MocA family oxidoreductase [Planctomycetaceae bacterium]